MKTTSYKQMLLLDGGASAVASESLWGLCNVSANNKKNNNTEPSEESLIDVVGGISGTYLARFQIGHIQSRTANFSKKKLYWPKVG